MLVSKWFVWSGMAIMTEESLKLTVIFPGNLESSSSNLSIKLGVRMYRASTWSVENTSNCFSKFGFSSLTLCLPRLSLNQELRKTTVWPWKFLLKSAIKKKPLKISIQCSCLRPLESVVTRFSSAIISEQIKLVLSIFPQIRSSLR